MFGAFLIGFATLAEEIGSSVSKYTIAHHKERPYSMAFVAHLAGLIGIVTIGTLLPAHFFAPNFPSGFTFSSASLPTLIPRIVLEMAQAHVAIFAVVLASRSTFSFIRILTIPLLLAVDFVLGYALGYAQVVGITLIILALVFLFRNHGIEKRGAGLVLFTAVNAVLTISLFKYNIAHFNSVEAEAGITLVVLTLYFFVLAIAKKERLSRHMLHPSLLLQFVSGSIATIAFSFAFLYMPPSIATAGKRALSSLWALGAGAVYFKERHILVKAAALCGLILGLVLLAL
ncbi:hypothetical protein HY969_00725 [Candidatus Kaiserbacteria bacterium]|nr:hypothetical protein [Candidatus Kaiserbacteria bacterium]